MLTWFQIALTKNSNVKRTLSKGKHSIVDQRQDKSEDEVANMLCLHMRTYASPVCFYISFVNFHFVECVEMSDSVNVVHRLKLQGPRL